MMKLLIYDKNISLGFRASPLEKELVVYPLAIRSEGGSGASGFTESDSFSRSQDGQNVRLRKKAIAAKNSVAQPLKQTGLDSGHCVPVVILPFVLHLSFMAATAFFVMHVQVATRFLSASPLRYWFASHVMGSPNIGKKAGYLIWTYCAAYIFLGSLLFSNFYPFT